MVAVGGLDAHQDGLPALPFRVRDLGPYVARRGNRLAGDIEDDVARGQSLLGRFAGRIDADDRDSLLIRARDLMRRGKLEAETAV